MHMVVEARQSMHGKQDMAHMVVDASHSMHRKQHIAHTAVDASHLTARGIAAESIYVMQRMQRQQTWQMKGELPWQCWIAGCAYGGPRQCCKHSEKLQKS